MHLTWQGLFGAINSNYLESYPIQVSPPCWISLHIYGNSYSHTEKWKPNNPKCHKCLVTFIAYLSWRITENILPRWSSVTLSNSALTKLLESQRWEHTHDIWREVEPTTTHGWIKKSFPNQWNISTNWFICNCRIYSFILITLLNI